jgi:hypothetical protein
VGYPFIDSSRSYQVLADALKNSQLKNLTIELLKPVPKNVQMLESASVAIIEALKTTSLFSLRLQFDFFTDNHAEAIGSFLKNSASIELLDLHEIPILDSYLRCGMIAEGLAGNKSLNTLKLTGNITHYDFIKNNADLLKEAINVNASVKTVAFEGLFGRNITIKIERKTEADYLLHQADAGNELKKNLHNKILVAKNCITKISIALETSTAEQKNIEKLLTETENQKKTLTSERDSLLKKLTVVESKMKKVDSKIKTNTEKFKKTKIENEDVARDLAKLQQFVASNEPELKKFQQKLNTDLSTWTRNDVAFLLKEIELPQYCDVFKQNGIDGAVLLTLDMNEFVSVLDVSFHDAEKIMMYTHLVQTRHDIYTPPNGPLLWSIEGVAEWLDSCQLSHLKPNFKKGQITGASLLFLEKTALKARLQITALGDIIKLQKEIAKLKDSLNEDKKDVDQQPSNMNEQKKQRKVPEAFKCPITHEIMIDPVFLSDGHTYERKAIEMWLQTHNSSPMTGLQLINKQLTPSHTLKSMICEFIDDNKKK